MTSLIRHLLTALTVLALSAGLAFGATPPAAEPGLENATAHAGKTVPVAGGETAGEDEGTGEEEGDEDTEDGETEDQEESEDDEGGETEEETEEQADAESDEDPDEDSDEGGAGIQHCSTDPSALTAEELATRNHGSVTCWAAHQDEWPEWFANRGAFVRCWAHQGKGGAASCTEAPEAADEAEVEPLADSTKADHGKGKGKGHGQGKAKSRLRM